MGEPLRRPARGRRTLNRKALAIGLMALAALVSLILGRPRDRAPAARQYVEKPVCAPAKARQIGHEQADRVIALVRAPETRAQGCAAFAERVAGSAPWAELLPAPPDCDWHPYEEERSPLPHALRRLAGFAPEAERLCGTLDLGSDPQASGALGLTLEEREAIRQFWTGDPGNGAGNGTALPSPLGIR